MDSCAKVSQQFITLATTYNKIMNHIFRLCVSVLFLNGRNHDKPNFSAFVMQLWSKKSFCRLDHQLQSSWYEEDLLLQEVGDKWKLKTTWLFRSCCCCCWRKQLQGDYTLRRTTWCCVHNNGCLLTKGNKQPRSCTIAGLWCCILSASHKAINNNPRALRYAQAWEAWGFYHWGFNLQWIQQSEFWSDAAWMLSQCLIDEFWRWLPSSRTLNHFHSKLQSSKRNHSLQFHLSSFLWYHTDHDNQN